MGTSIMLLAAQCCAGGSQNRRRKTRAWRLSPRVSPTLLLLPILILVGGSAPFELARAEPAQLQRGQPQVAPQQSPFELAGLQDSSSQFASGSGVAAVADSASLGEGLSAFANSYKRGPFANAKRARKMSAFMPMRGRKDGRDLVGQDSIREARSGMRHAIVAPAADSLGGGVQLGGAFDGLSGGQYASSFNSNSFQQTQVAPLRESEPGDMNLVRLFRGRATLPRQFFNQVQARAASSQGYLQSVMPEQQVVDLELGLMARDAGGGGGDGDGDGGAHSDALRALGSGRVMRAKPRRAFHPMRGKRSHLMLRTRPSRYNSTIS